jgi:hypothetical protein
MRIGNEILTDEDRRVLGAVAEEASQARNQINALETKVKNVSRMYGGEIWMRFAFPAVLGKRAFFTGVLNPTSKLAELRALKPCLDNADKTLKSLDKVLGMYAHLGDLRNLVAYAKARKALAALDQVKGTLFEGEFLDTDGAPRRIDRAAVEAYIALREPKVGEFLFRFGLLLGDQLPVSDLFSDDPRAKRHAIFRDFPELKGKVWSDFLETAIRALGGDNRRLLSSHPSEMKETLRQLAETKPEDFASFSKDLGQSPFAGLVSLIIELTKVLMPQGRVTLTPGQLEYFSG